MVLFLIDSIFVWFEIMVNLMKWDDMIVTDNKSWMNSFKFKLIATE